MPPLNKKYIVPLIHIVIWLCLFLYPFIFHYIPLTDIRAVLRISIFLFLLMSFFYANTIIFIPKILGRKKIILYLIVIVAAVVLISYTAGYLQIILNPDYKIKPALYDRALNTGIISSILVLIISSSIKVTNEWFRNQQLMRSAENEKLNAELNFLKSQVNPHFIFNALNNIYSLENRKSPDTGPAILKLSELIRYMLYDTSADYVPLEKEIEYLENYIELQKLGLGKEMVVSFETKGDFSGKQIRPMLLIPLVENVFKHGLSYVNKSGSFISIKTSPERLEIITRNPVAGEKEKLKEGIGLANLRKRLDLLYPGKHEFSISKDNGIFITHLSIVL